MTRLSHPPSQFSLLKKCAAFLLGIIFLAVTSFLFLALISWNPLDPSWNTATDQAPQNWMGEEGALLSDLLRQAFGKASYFVVFAGVGGAGRLLWSPPPLPLIRFFLSLIGGTLLLSLALARLGEGGSFGWQASLYVPWLFQPWGYSLLWTIWGIFCWLLYPISFHVIQKMLSGFARMGSAPFRWVWSLGSLFSRRSAKALRGAPGSHIPFLDEAESMEAFSDVPFMPAAKKPDSPSRGRMMSPQSSQQGDALSKKRAFSPGQTTTYHLPPLVLLSSPETAGHKKTVSTKVLEKSAQALHSVLEDFGIKGHITGVNPGPVVTLYELEPAAGLKSSRVIGLADDIARSMSAVSARVAIVPGRNIIGIELPNASREGVLLRELLEALDHPDVTLKLALALGKDIAGKPIMADLTRMPHLLVAGTTGSGKSVGINAMILSLVYRLPPERCKFIMIDPKMLELSVYDGIPHLLTPVVTDPKKAVVALKWAVREMENRYRAMSQLGVRNIEGYNHRVLEALAQDEALKRTVQVGFDEAGKPVFEEQPLKLAPLPFIVVVVDEMADLMLVAGKEIEAAVQRLAQMARAAGIHLIMATQRPSVDVITGTIKANFPTRISFQVTSKIDSRTILGEQGAEQLLGQGDMLYMAAGGRIVRVHGPFVSDAEVEKVVNFLKTQGEPVYITDLLNAFDAADSSGSWGEEQGGEGEDKLYRQAVEIVQRHRKASTSYIQRQLQIGYNRAARLIERMEQEGLVSAPNHVGKRDIFMESGKDGTYG